jgi:hypothetical protein
LDDDGTHPQLMDYFRVALTPLDDVQLTLDKACEVLEHEGFEFPAQALEGARKLCAMEHTDEARLAFDMAQKGLTPKLSLLPSPRKEICFDLSDIRVDGSIESRLLKCVVVDGVNKARPKFHRIAITPMTHCTSFFQNIRENVMSRGFGPIVDGDCEHIERVCSLFHTPEVVARFKLHHYTSLLNELKDRELQGWEPNYPEHMDDTQGRVNQAQADFDLAMAVVTP